MKLTIYTDGGARGNPGPAASAYVVYDESRKLIEKSANYLGVNTNNQAEYDGVLQAFKWLVKQTFDSPVEVTFIIDSLLVVNQLNGKFKIKNPGIAVKIMEIKKLENQITKVDYQHVLRDKNTVADALVNECLDLHA